MCLLIFNADFFKKNLSGHTPQMYCVHNYNVADYLSSPNLKWYVGKEVSRCWGLSYKWNGKHAMIKMFKNKEWWIWNAQLSKDNAADGSWKPSFIFLWKWAKHQMFSVLSCSSAPQCLRCISIISNLNHREYIDLQEPFLILCLDLNRSSTVYNLYSLLQYKDPCTMDFQDANNTFSNQLNA